MRKWCINGVVDIIQAPETLEKSGGRENYEIRHRNFTIYLPHGRERGIHKTAGQNDIPVLVRSGLQRGGQKHFFGSFHIGDSKIKVDKILDDCMGAAIPPGFHS